MASFCEDPLWDINISWNTSSPALTNCFKLTVLIWVPCALLWLCTPIEVYFMKKSEYRNIPWSFFNVTKYLVLFLLIVLTIVDLVVTIKFKDSQILYDVYIASPIIKLGTFILCAVLVYFNQKYGIHTSAPHFFFSLILMIFAIPQFVSEINAYSARNNRIGYSEKLLWIDYQFVSQMIYFPLTLLLLVLNCFSDKQPKDQQGNHSKKPNPLLRVSVLNQILYQYFDEFQWRGYRKPLVADDMYDIRVEDSCEKLLPAFEKHFKKYDERKRIKKIKSNKKYDDGYGSTQGSVMPAIVKAFFLPFWMGGILKLMLDLLTFASPFLLRLLITFTQNDEPRWKGFFYTACLFLAAFVSALINGQYSYLTYLVGFRIRSALVSAIYRKSLKISNAAKQQATVGELTNLMSVDAQRFFELMSLLHLLWSTPLTIVLCFYFLWSILGVACITGIALIVLLLPLNGYISLELRKLQIDQMVIKDNRVKFMNEILNGIKVLKLYAWEHSFEGIVKAVRSNELIALKKMAIYNSLTFAVFSLTPFIVTLGTLATYVLISPENVLDAQTAFVSLALFNILRHPMGFLSMMIAQLMQALVGATRISRYLNLPELNPNNVTHNKNENGLLIENGTFSWNVKDKEILSNINLVLPKKQLIALVGPVGCGKSSVVSAFLGEMEKISGNVNTDGSIAYVPQQAWIQNATLKSNIIFGKEYDDVLYNKVIDACALRSDFEMLPGGDLTEIGEKGINLSGGQKQRVSLARAVYADADIYLLDDPLSAVDSHVGKHIFDNVVGPNGLLKRTTRLLVTHGISFLPEVDNIYVMKNGTITESGSYRNLLEQKGAFSELLTEYLRNFQSNDKELEEIKEVLLNTDSTNKILFDRAFSVVSNLSSTRRETKESLFVPEQLENNNAKLITNEESATGDVSSAVYWQYIKRIGFKMWVFIIIFSILYQVCSIYSNTWLTFWSEDERSVDPNYRDIYLGVYGALGAGQAISLFISSLLLGIGSVWSAKSIHNNLLEHVFRLPMSFFDTTPLGRILNRFSKDVDVVDTVLPNALRAFLIMSLNVAGTMLIISITTPLFMSVIIPLAILYYLIQKFYIATSRQLRRIESVTRSPIYSQFGETITGQSTIRAYNQEDQFIKKSDEKIDFNQQCSFPGVIANRWLAVRLEVLGSLIVLFAALFAVLARDTITGGFVGLSLSYALQITAVLAFLVRMTSEVENNIIAVERIAEYSNLIMEDAWEKGAINPEWPEVGQVEFNNFQVRYREGLDLVLRGLTFTVQSCEKVGIVGRTGAGKSSLTLSLFRLIESAGGQIIIDGIDISTLGLQSLRSRLTIIPQDPVLFSGTLRMNIDPFNKYTDDEIWRALEHSHLKFYVKGLDQGLLHNVSEGGENLSVGQRQLVCLARALLRKTKVLILDEATAAVDLETDELIQNTIRTEFKDCTILTIAHRLNTILDSDKIIVLDQGLIVEFDSPENLLKNENGVFYGLAKEAGIVS